MTIWIFTTSLTVSIIFSIACFFIKNEPARDMKSKFESGMDQSEQELPSFYMHFFYVGILFLIFDVEIVLSIPMIQTTMKEDLRLIFWSSFIMIIFIGLLMEMMIDSIEWKE